MISYTHTLCYENATLSIVLQAKFVFVPTLSILRVLHYKMKGILILIYTATFYKSSCLMIIPFEISHRHGGAHKIIPEQYPFLILTPLK